MISQNSSGFIFKRNTCTITIPKLNGAPDWSVISEPTLSLLQADYEAAEEIATVPDPVPFTTPVVADWDGLQAHLLAGDLNPIFARLTVAAIDSNPLSTARGDVTDSILTVRVEAALASAIQLLKMVGWMFTDEEIELWNDKVSALGFSEIVKI